MNKFSGILRTNDKGDLLIYNRGSFDDYFRQNPSSEWEFQAVMINKEPGNRLFAYLDAVILPVLIEGFRNTGENHNKASVSEEMKKYIPVVWESKRVGGEMKHFAREFGELNYFERKRYIDEAIIFAAENLDIKIEEPK